MFDGDWIHPKCVVACFRETGFVVIEFLWIDGTEFWLESSVSFEEFNLTISQARTFK